MTDPLTIRAFIPFPPEYQIQMRFLLAVVTARRNFLATPRAALGPCSLADEVALQEPSQEDGIWFFAQKSLHFGSR
jgi:hypothetical protein